MFEVLWGRVTQSGPWRSFKHRLKGPQSEIFATLAYDYATKVPSISPVIAAGATFAPQLPGTGVGASARGTLTNTKSGPVATIPMRMP